MLSESGATAIPARVLLVGSDPRAATIMVEMLRDAWPAGLLVTHAASVGDAAHELADHGDSCVLLDVEDEGDDLTALHALVAAAPDAAIVVVSDRHDEALGVEAVTAGAQDHLLRSELRPALLTRSVRYALERKRAEVRLSRRALEDPLTGLPNRMLFLDRLGVALDRSRRTGLAPAVMFLDVDSFKAINDSLGHAAGDRLLRTLSERFGALLRPMDTVARIGGDEFTFLFEGLSGREEATVIARRVGEAASLPITLGMPDQPTTVAVSIGVTVLEDPSASPEDALADADTAMYRAKSFGGGRAEMFDGVVAPAGAGMADDPSGDRATALTPAGPPAAPSLAPAASPLASVASPLAPASPSAAAASPLTPVPDPQPQALDERALRAALTDGDLRVHYQPRVSIDGRTGLVGFEALVRWEHPERGLVVPAEFMDLAEESGLIVEIGAWVIAEALRQVRRWRQTRPGMTISVNLSRRQLADRELVTGLRDALRDARAEPSVLWLEIAEEAILHDPELTARVLGELSDLGVGLAVDDFGHGPAPAARLRALPLEMLKIDRGVVSRLQGDSPDSELVETLVDLGHELGLSVVAEGVETDRQLALARDLGCDGAQGFLFSRPVPEESVRELLGAG